VCEPIERLYDEQLYPNGRSTVNPLTDICSTNGRASRSRADEHLCVERVFDATDERLYDVTMPDKPMTRRQREILEFIESQTRERGFPPSVREIGEAVGLTSPSTVHSHLNTLTKQGYLRRDPTKPRAIEVRWDPNSGVMMERRPVRHVPLVGDVAAGTDVLAQENVEELFPVPTDFTGDGDLFMLRVRGESMIEAGILDGDFVIAAQQNTARHGDIVVAGIPGDEATVKTYREEGDRVVLVPANSTMEPMVFSPDDVTIYGRVVTVMRRL
jgi:repressor LexA